jgi:ribosomal protein S18 acetylase RimI-like enzyme
MTTAVLDNPLWSSLSTLHRSIARASGDALRYPAEVAPFLAIPDPRALTAGALDALVAPDETVLMLGAEPAPPPGWQLESLGSIMQMICSQPLAATSGPAVLELTEAHRPAVLALTALVYPHYFRPHTMDLGRYIGVLDGDRLDAMLGERMGFPGYREISAVCTHPDRAGRGLARHLLAHASNRLFDERTTPFLHVSPKNERAIRLYEQNYYRTRTAVPFWALRRD